MSFVVACTCGKQFNVKEENAGKRGRCSGCGAIMVLSRPAAQRPAKPAPAPAEADTPDLDQIDWNAVAAASRARPAVAQHAAPAGPAPARPVARRVVGLSAPAVQAPAYVGTDEQAPAAGRRPCPSCGQQISAHALECEFCGEPVSGRAGTAKKGRPSSRRGGQVTLSDVLRVPFDGNLASEAVLLVLGYLGWVLGIAVLAVATAVVGALLIAATRSPIVALVVNLLFLGMMVLLGLRMLAWVAKRMLGVVEQYASGGLVSGTDRSSMVCLGTLIVSVLVPIALMIVGFVLVPINIAIGLVVILFAAGVYAPMSVAMAGADGTLNPLKVFAKIFSPMFPAYLMVLVYLIPFALLVGVAQTLATIGGQYLIAKYATNQYSAALVALVASLLSTVVGAYGTFGELAMLGMLLRKFRTPGARLSAAEFGASLIWVVPAIMVVAVVIALAFVFFWRI